LRFCLRLLLLAAMLLAPVGRIGMAEAAGRCGGMPAMAPVSHAGMQHRGAPKQDNERQSVDCLIACAAIAALPTPMVAPLSLTRAAAPRPLPTFAPRGLHPDAELPPPRLS
jgi:hypothetical protein